MDKEFYSVPEFATLFGLKPGTIRKAIRSGRIIGVRVTDARKGHYRIPANQKCRLIAMAYEILENKKEESWTETDL